MRISGPADVTLPETSVIDFFDRRARAAEDPTRPTVTMLQDTQQAVALERNRVEQEALLATLARRPLAPRATIDVGCGAGRLLFAMGEALGERYLGLDGSGSLIEAARTRVAAASMAGAHFAVQDLGQPGLLAHAAPIGAFDLLLCSGILIYLNERSVQQLLADLMTVAAPGATIILREPVGIDTRLTLVDHWSEELQAGYSAVYRTRDELQALVAAAAGDRLEQWSARWLYEDPALNNRDETRQAWMVGTLR